MGIIMGALGGAGDYLAGAMQQRVKTLDQMDLETHRSELETQKAKALADYSAVLQDNARQASANRIDTARTGIIGKAIDSQYAGAVPADASTWTPEQQAAVDQSKGIDTAKMQNDPEITAKAAISTGDLSVKESIALAREDNRNARDDKRVDAMAAETARKAKHDEEWAKAQERKDETYRHRIDSMLAAKLGSGEKSEKVMSYMEGKRKEINSDSSDLKAQFNADMKNAEFDPPEKKAQIKAQYAPKFQAIEESRRQLDADFDSLREKFGLPPTKTKGDSKPITINALPAGAKQIGTSGGKPVYETADGKRFIGS